MSKEKLVFKVMRRDKICVYQCVTTTRTIDEVLPILKERFDIKTYPVKILCNDVEVARWNFATKANPAIIDEQTGIVFANIEQMMEALGVSRNQALWRIRQRKRYYWHIDG
jgi:hypothetical protein